MSVTIERQDGVAWVTMDDGGTNAMNGDLIEGLRVAALKLADSPPLAVVLTGNGFFSTGLPPVDDPFFKPFSATVANRDAFRAQEILTRQRTALEALSRLACPLVAAIEGACRGPAIALALGCDLRVASRDTTFQDADLADGVLSGFGTLSHVAARAGLELAIDMVLTQRALSAEEALQYGLVHRVCEPQKARDAARQLLEPLLACPTGARTQALMALRAIHAQRLQLTGDAEAQAAGRAWTRGEWQR